LKQIRSKVQVDKSGKYLLVNCLLLLVIFGCGNDYCHNKNSNKIDIKKQPRVYHEAFLKWEKTDFYYWPQIHGDMNSVPQMVLRTKLYNYTNDTIILALRLGNDEIQKNTFFKLICINQYVSKSDTIRVNCYFKDKFMKISPDSIVSINFTCKLIGENSSNELYLLALKYASESFFVYDSPYPVYINAIHSIVIKTGKESLHRKYFLTRTIQRDTGYVFSVHFPFQRY
jgi:hypothetical protein